MPKLDLDEDLYAPNPLLDTPPSDYDPNADPSVAFGLKTYRRKDGLKGLDDVKIDRLCALLESGNFLETSLLEAGVSQVWWRRIKHQVARIRNPELDADFRLDLRSNEQKIWLVWCAKIATASARAEIRAVQSWNLHFERNWQACAAFLAKRFPENWGVSHGSSASGSKPAVNISINQTQSTQIAGNQAQKQALIELIQGMSIEQEQELLHEYARTVGAITVPEPAKVLCEDGEDAQIDLMSGDNGSVSEDLGPSGNSDITIANRDSTVVARDFRRVNGGNGGSNG
jgi:hypothetical protein